MELNPALTGAYDGTFRLAAIYRDQWGGLVDNPWQTYGLAGDLRFKIGKQTHSDYVGGGVQFMSDRVQMFDFNTLGIKLSGAFHKHLDDRSRQFLSGGFYFGLLQRNVNLEALRFDDQFNGLDGYANSTREDLPINNFAFLDMGFGLNYTISTSENSRFSAGVSMAHINKPSASFSARTAEVIDPAEVPTYLRWSGYMSAVLALNRSVDLIPRIIVTGQKTSLAANIGSNVRFDLNKYETSALQLGAGLQFAQDLGNFKPASAYLFAGIEFGTVLLGLSYDMNLNDLANERDGQGVFEFSVTYIGAYENNAAFCPEF